MRRIDVKLIEEEIYKLALKAGVNLTDSCRQALENAENKETSPTCAYALSTLSENALLASALGLPVCQDTGMATVIMEIGQEVYLAGKPLKEAVDSGVRRAYADGYFRKSICDPLTRVNTADNTPAALHTEIVDGDKIKISFLAKGFGSENMSKLYMLTPSQGKEGIIEAVVNTVKEAGSRPCPPVYVGVGIGSNFDGCAYLAKKALLRDIGEHNPRGEVAEIESEILKRVNKLHIGCQGFGGDITALGVSCEVAPTHIAGLPVAVNIQCHCIRCEKVII